jgi:hypothetical protein
VRILDDDRHARYDSVFIATLQIAYQVSNLSRRALDD